MRYGHPWSGTLKRPEEETTYSTNTAIFLLGHKHGWGPVGLWYQSWLFRACGHLVLAFLRPACSKPKPFKKVLRSSKNAKNEANTLKIAKLSKPKAYRFRNPHDDTKIALLWLQFQMTKVKKESQFQHTQTKLNTSRPRKINKMISQPREEPPKKRFQPETLETEELTRRKNVKEKKQLSTQARFLSLRKNSNSDDHDKFRNKHFQ